MPPSARACCLACAPRPRHAARQIGVQRSCVSVPEPRELRGRLAPHPRDGSTVRPAWLPMAAAPFRGQQVASASRGRSLRRQQQRGHVAASPAAGALRPAGDAAGNRRACDDGAVHGHVRPSGGELRDPAFGDAARSCRAAWRGCPPVGECCRGSSATDTSEHAPRLPRSAAARGIRDGRAERRCAVCRLRSCCLPVIVCTALPI